MTQPTKTLRERVFFLFIKNFNQPTVSDVEALIKEIQAEAFDKVITHMEQKVAHYLKQQEGATGIDQMKREFATTALAYACEEIRQLKEASK